MRNEYAQMRSKSLELGTPVSNQRCGHDDHAGRRVCCPLPLAQTKERYDLDRLAKPHVIGKTCAEAHPGEEMQPARAALLVRAQHCGEAGDFFPIGRLPELIEQRLQVFSRKHFHPIASSVEVRQIRPGSITRRKSREPAHAFVK
jgi:hypothetical protein